MSFKFPFVFLLFFSISFSLRAQVQLDRPIQLTGNATDAKIEGVKAVSLDFDAASKIYVDTAIANRSSSGGNCSSIEIPEAGPNTSGINGSPVNLAAQLPYASTGTWSVHSGSGGSFGNVGNASTTFSGSSNATYVLKWTLSSPGCPSVSDYLIVTFNTANYASGNAAYWTERLTNYRPVTIGSDPTVFTYDATNNVYRNTSTGKILLPTISRQGSPQPETVNDNSFYGFNGGSASNTNFQWDSQVTLSNHVFDVRNMFVSPLTTSGMTYCALMQTDMSSCSSSQTNGNDNPIQYPQNAVFAYTSTPNGTGPYYMNNGQDLVPSQSITNFGNKRVSQQALTTDGFKKSYCVETYGNGWRLPTDIEVGRPNSLKDNGTPALNTGYLGTNDVQVWTTAYGCQDGGTTCYVYYRQTYRNNNAQHTWPWSSGQLQFNTANHARCVYGRGQ